MGGTNNFFAAPESAGNRARKEPQGPAGRVSTPRPAASSSAPAPKLTKWATREAARRRRTLAKFNELVQAGCSRRAAARQLRVNYTNIWRWQRRIIPNTGNTGTKPAYSRFKISSAVLDQVERLQLNGRGNAAAWRAVASYCYCPPALAEVLRSTRNIPASFLSATRLKRETATVIRGRNFSVIQA